MQTEAASTLMPVSLHNCCTTFSCSTPVQCSISFFFNYVIFCPLNILQIFSDVACHRKILDAKVKCPNRGCTWTGELRDVRVRIDHFTLRFFALFQPSTLFNLYCNQIDTSLWRFWRISHKLYARIPSFSLTWYIWTRSLNFQYSCTASCFFLLYRHRWNTRIVPVTKIRYLVKTFTCEDITVVMATSVSANRRRAS